MLEMLLGNTVVAAALAALVLSICRCCRPSPAARHALWLVVVLKLLTPVGLIWALPLPFEKPRFLDDAEKSEPPPVGAENLALSIIPWEPVGSLAERLPATDVLQIEPLWIGAEAAVKCEEPAIVVPLDPPIAARINGSTYLWLLMIWLAGALIVAGRSFRRTALFARYARTGKPASPSLQRQVAELATVLGVRAPLVRVLAELPSPVVWCLFRPVLLWPKGLQNQIRSGGRRAVLVHELAHLRRRDHWVRWLELAAAILHWWNPLFWLARRQMRFHAELACDAWVTGTLPDIRRDYAEALLEVCARASSRAAAPSPAVGVGGDGRRDFQRRLTMIMREQAPCRLAAGAKLLVVLLAMAALPAWTLGQGKPEAKPQPKAEKKSIVIQDVLFDLAVDSDQATDAVKAKDLEAKIAALQAELAKLKAPKAVPKEAGGTFFFKIVPDGKAIEVKPAPQKETPKGTAQGQPFRIELKLENEPKSPPYKVIGPDGKEIKGAKVIFGEQNPPAETLKAQIEALRWIKEKMAQQETALKYQEALRAEAAQKRKDVEKKQEGLLQQQEAMLKLKELKRKEIEKQHEADGKQTTIRFDEMIAAPTNGGKVITLTRATYKLPKVKAESLTAFLKANVKPSVLEVKFDEKEGLTVTTTPETQATIRSLVKLMAQNAGGQPLQFQLHFDVDTPKKGEKK